MRSLSEIETTSKRASRAAGFSWGISEEVGKSIRLLELFGLPGIKNLNQYFKEKNLKNFENLKLITEENHPKTSAYCPINLGVCFLDQIQTMETYEKFSFKHIAYPLLLLPFLSRCSELIGKRILFNFDDKKFLLNFNLNISSNSINNEYPLIAENIEIIFVDNKDNFSELEWKNLYKLSEQTFVEERDSLKQGAAGAGLTDND
tara:strand:+ start:843 stop:1454 length:612 start_codon:yes stop_codon:yes gene_type:complete